MNNILIDTLKANQKYYESISNISEARLLEKSITEIEKLSSENKQLNLDIEKEVTQRDYWEEKATELANNIGKALRFEVGEHSNMNCPVQTAIDGVFQMAAQIKGSVRNGL